MGASQLVGLLEYVYGENEKTHASQLVGLLEYMYGMGCARLCVVASVLQMMCFTTQLDEEKSDKFIEIC